MYKGAKKKTGEVDFLLFMTIMILVSIGVIMVFSASYPSSLKKGDGMYYLRKQGMWWALGLTAMIIIQNIDYHKYKRYTKVIMIFTVILLLAVFLPIFKPVNGARRWISFPGFSLQPSELAKYVVILFMAQSIENKGSKMKSFWQGVVPFLLVSGFFAALVLAEKNLSIASVIMIVTLLVLFTAGCDIKHIILVVGLVVALGVVGILIEPFRLKRISSFMNPWADPQGSSYQLIQSLLALGAGGISGVGLGLSRQTTYTLLPEPHNDFIFAVIGEETGLVGCLFIIGLFIFFVFRGLRIASKAPDIYGTMLSVGITGIIAIQALINIAVVTGTMPVTGVPLPFISYGGSSLVVNMAAMGILLNISRHIKKV